MSAPAPAQCNPAKLVIGRAIYGALALFPVALLITLYHFSDDGRGSRYQPTRTDPVPAPSAREMHEGLRNGLRSIPAAERSAEHEQLRAEIEAWLAEHTANAERTTDAAGEAKPR